MKEAWDIVWHTSKYGESMQYALTIVALIGALVGLVVGKIMK